MSEALQTPELERLAVIGMAGRFPMASDLDEYWRNLRDGVECITFGVDDGPGSFVPAGGVLEGFDLFDAPFFGLSARDAEAMDPQHRLFLECAWHSLESAGYRPDDCPGLVGVFGGAAMSFYLADLSTNDDALAAFDSFQLAIGNDKDHLTTQVAYKLNLRGPSLTVQTACSTSLVAVCLACQSLLNYQCDIALAGGVSADATTGDGYTFQPGGIFSPDGHCRPFDAAAAGTIPGNGVGIVVLKRLSEALAHGDPIRAVISGFALNNDGFRKVGYTAPSVDGQAEVIAMAHALAGVEPSSITYVEAHGTGTALGDPIEIAALDQVFGRPTHERGFCAIGSVKSNIGHLDTAAGIASLIKTVLALEHRQIPPTLHFLRPNPEIDFERSAFRVNATLMPWPATREPRRAGVSSFGIGGTNAHVVLEEAPAAGPPADSPPFVLLALAARTASALEGGTDGLAAHLQAHPELDLADVAYTGHVGRKPFEHRRVLVAAADDVVAAGRALGERDPRRVRTRVADAPDPAVFFLFPGQGAQAVGMAAGLYRHEPRFRDHVDRCCDLLAPALGLDLRTLLWPEPERRDEAEQLLRRTLYTQPALFTIEYALAQLWLEWGVRPAGMLGHSVGEWVAACLASVIPLDDALELVAARARLMDAMPRGAMLAVALPEASVERYLSPQVSLAAVNGPAACVLSGPSETIDELQAELAARGTQVQRLATSHAFHSAAMDAAAAEVVAAVRAVALQPPRIPFVSNVTGRWIRREDAVDARYWGRQVRETVRFADGIDQLCDTAGAILLEVGPGRGLANLARHHPARDAKQYVLSSLPGGDDTSDDAALLGTLGDLWLHGVEPSWERFHAGERRRRVPLPGYAFDHRRYFVEPADADAIDPAAGTRGWFSYPSWLPAPPRETVDAERQTPSWWLLLDDDTSLSQRVRELLRGKGSAVVSVWRGDAFAAIDETHYAVRPDAGDDYVRLLEDLQHRYGTVEAIVHLWTAVALSEDGLDATVFERHQADGFLSLVALAQALERLGLATPLRLDVVTRGVHVVLGTEPLVPSRATLSAPCLVLPQERPSVRCRLVDVDTPGDDGAVERLARSLTDELTTTPFAPIVAYRNGRRWLRTFDAAVLDDGDGRHVRTRPGGAYLLTGGLGNVGSAIARHLGRSTRGVKLVLTGRSTLPPRSEWAALLEHELKSVVAERIAVVLDLEAAGAEVAYFSADVADRGRMADVLREAEQRFGPLDGVVHGAGDVDAYFALDELDAASVEQQFRPKAVGLIVLDELLRGRPLDFCVLLSSTSALLGGVGLAGYAAANCFLDAFAAHRNRDGDVPWITINWGAWHFAQDDEPVPNRILPWQGEDAFAAILARAPQQVVVAPGGLLRAEPLPGAPAHDGATPRVAVGMHARPDLSTAYVVPRSVAERELVSIWEQLLGVTPIGAFDDFFELGGHSLLAIQLVSRLRRSFGVDVPVRLVFDLSTIAGLAEEVAGDLADDAEVADALQLVERLSEAEVMALLEQDDAVAPGGGV